MTLDQSALLDLLDVMRTADDNELMRRLLGSIMQALVDAEATSFIGAEPCASGWRETPRLVPAPSPRRARQA